MKVVHVNTSNKGGAGIAALRLHERLLEKGIDSTFLSLHSFPSEVEKQVQFQRSDCSRFPVFVDLLNFISRVLKKLGMRNPYPKGLEEKHLQGRAKELELFSLPFSSYSIQDHPLVKQADIVHLHWVSDGFLDFRSFFQHIDKKIVWTLHDMFPFTGGCHHSDGCMHFTSSCDSCPQLKGTIDQNYAAKMLSVKKAGMVSVKDDRMIVVSPSRWLNQLSLQSTLFGKFRQEVVANPLNTDVFKLRDKQQARKNLSLPDNKKVILFVAHSLGNARKGGPLLMESLKLLNADSDIVLCSVGSDADAIQYPLPHTSYGYVNAEDRMADMYAAADVFVLPSMAENFPNTICESLLCGTPVVAFAVGGITELINEQNGQLAAPFNTAAFAAALRDVLDHPERFDRVRISERAHSQLNPELSTKRYIEIYSDLLS
jgi:glycosyltransferase involved in cell wall biosynthesis